MNGQLRLNVILPNPSAKLAKKHCSKGQSKHQDFIGFLVPYSFHFCSVSLLYLLYTRSIHVLVPILYLFCTCSQMPSLLGFFWGVLYKFEGLCAYPFMSNFMLSIFLLWIAKNCLKKQQNVDFTSVHVLKDADFLFISFSHVVTCLSSKLACSHSFAALVWDQIRF